MKLPHQSSPSIFFACDGDAAITPRLLASGMDNYNQYSSRDFPLPPVDWKAILDHSRLFSNEDAERQIKTCDIFIFQALPSYVKANSEAWEAIPHALFQQAVRCYRKTGTPHIFLFWGRVFTNPEFEIATVKPLHSEEVRFRNRLQYLLKNDNVATGPVECEIIAHRIQRLADVARRMDRQREGLVDVWAKLERRVLSMMWICERPPGLRWRIRAYGNLARIFFYLSQPYRTKTGHLYLNTAAAFYRRSLLISETLGDQEGQGMSCSGLGHISQHMASDDAEEWHKKALAIHTSLNRPELMAQDYDALGYVYRCKHRSDASSADMFSKALAIWRTLKNESKIAWSLSNAARALYYAQQYEQARDLIWEAVPLHEKLRDFSGIAWDYYFCGLIYWQNRDLETAQEYLSRSLENFVHCNNDTMVKQVREHLEKLSS